MKKSYLIASLVLIGLISFCAFFSLITKIIWLQIVLGIYFYVAIIVAGILTLFNISEKQDTGKILKGIGGSIIWGPILLWEVIGIFYILIFRNKPGPIYLKGK